MDKKTDFSREHTELPWDRSQERDSPAILQSVSASRRLRPQQLSAPGSTPSGGALSPHRWCRGKHKLQLELAG